MFGRMEVSKNKALQKVIFWDDLEKERPLSLEDFEERNLAKEDFKYWSLMEED